MGSISRADRCERFMQEFNDDAVGIHGVASDSAVTQNLDMMEGWDQVYLHILFKFNGEEVLLILPTLFFDPEEPHDDAIERARSLLQLEEGVVEERFRKAGLHT